MDLGREECTGSSSCTEDSGDSSDRYAYHYHDAKADSRRILTSSLSSSSLLQRRFSLLSCIMVLALALGGIGNEAGLGLATAGTITLPVIRSFSQLEGSGSPVEGRSSSSSGNGGGGGMTPEHAQLLRDHDYQRSLRHHGRVLSTTVADFPLGGNDYQIGLYYTEIGLGTPSNNYFVQVDSGSDLLWVNCKPCQLCPSSSDLPIALLLYDPSASRTSSNISCSANACSQAQTISNSPCLDNSCSYSIQYGDGSTAMGYLVQDTITYDTGVYSNKSMTSASAKVIFGCGFNQTGESLTTNSRAVDGIMGFGRQALSVVSQLADGGFTANEFAHCLQGDTGQGGIFVIGDVQEPGIVYTSLLKEEYHYNVVLESISMGGVTLNVPPSAFDTVAGSGDSGTIFDSGTTLALLVDQAYDAFVSQLTAVAPVEAIYPVSNQPEMPCFLYSSNDVSSAFPPVTLNFQGPAAMDLVPTNYLFQQSIGSSNYYCLGWSKGSSSNLPYLTILGDIVLKNKLVVYDLENTRIGWVTYDCLTSVQVGNGTGAEVVNPSNTNGSGSLSLQALNSIAVVISSVLLMCAATFL